MTRLVYDQFAKDYLTGLLTPLGEVETNRDVPDEMQQIDVRFIPYQSERSDNAQVLGLLGQIARTPSIFVPFHNAVSPNQIRSCMGKLFDIYANLQRQYQQENSCLEEAILPWLWILSPTVSSTISQGFKAEQNLSKWPSGVYFLGESLKTGIVAIDQLPPTEETLWLRLLGKDNVQKQAINEVGKLPANHPLRANALLLLVNLQATIQANKNIDREDRELIMELSPLLLQWREEALHEGEERGLQQGLERGARTERRIIIESFLRARFGDLDKELSGIIQPLLELPTEEFAVLLLQLSREELLARFSC
ncbi:hypothetical protein ACE1B6_11655 [Aerosakkonemataceae cyanobacterium BLCC-F154]|uniref:Flagellar assembly protein H n=1 Tax=Floridaenema fluviatile BLCC-F154 TaxID=3153640 RepID=A0ABV4YAQ3_9CYAN